MSGEKYVNPWEDRYASQEMLGLFSPLSRHTLWRKLWLALAESEKELGLPITDEQIQQLQNHLTDIDYDAVARYEEKLKHDVMAHIHAWADQCPAARSIIHLGATSCFVTDNGDLLQMQQGFQLILDKLKKLMVLLADFAAKYRNLPCLAYTHFQAAQLTTVGKRACLWLQDFLWDFNEITARKNGIHFLGTKGATGTQASFLKLFEGDPKKVQELETLVAKKMGFSHVLTITGQTYPRKLDNLLVQSLIGLGLSAHKMASDIRLLAHTKEIEEGFEGKQVGSSAMPYKRNPVESERICGIARYLVSLGENTAYTASTQWFERTLDDSSNRRLTLSAAFLAADSLLSLLIGITQNLVVNQKIIARKIQDELPFMATENILMQAVAKGGDRQALHEELRQLSHAAVQRVKEEGQPNNLLEQIANHPSFDLTIDDLNLTLDPMNFIGLAPEQVSSFLDNEVKPALNS